MKVIGQIGDYKGNKQRVSSTSWNPDFDRGLIWQMMRDRKLNKEIYMRFITDPIVFFNPVKDARLFDFCLLEIFTKTPWYIILVCWLPVIGYYLYRSLVLMPLVTLPIFLFGMLLWSFFEYLIHRFLFHGETIWLPNFRPLIIFHFLIHGIHHTFPQDRYRLVFPPLPGLLLLRFVFMPPFNAILPNYVFYPMLAGGAFGYVCYDMIHYFLHHMKLETPGSYWRNLKLYHMRHHFKVDNKGFGVS